MSNASKLINNAHLWDITKAPCSWRGVTCSSGNSSVTKISLSGFSLNSSDFLPLLCQIDSLESLDISKSQLPSIPNEFITACAYSYMDWFPSKSLNLSVNHFTGLIPKNLSSVLEQLQLSVNEFHAYKNQFEGTIPSGITTNLRNLDLSFNNLSGSIPSDLLSPPKLHTIDLSYNLLTGPIPSNISTKLIRLKLGSNSLNETIHTSTCGTLQNLMYLELENNSLTGSVPPDLGSCSNLALLSLAVNSLTGTLPIQLGNLHHLQVMKLQSNKLIGGIPIEITQI
nr:leucine-rich repeat receptor-like tyrosine-protein kinase pxc3 [Quercus suber]